MEVLYGNLWEANIAQDLDETPTRAATHFTYNFHIECLYFFVRCTVCVCLSLGLY